jgi:LysM repeat protein
MKHLPLFSSLGCTFALVATSAHLLAQPAGNLPSSYTYLQPPPPGYGTLAPPPPQRQSSIPPRTSTVPKRTQAPSPAPRYGPLPNDLSLQVARLAANDHEQDSRIRKLEKDVATVKGGSIHLANYDSSSASLRSHTTYVVKPGDSLWAIASRHRVSPGDIIQLNRMKSDTVIIGQQLQIPGPHGSTNTTKATYKPYYHDVRPGDTSSIIAKKYGVTRTSLMEANPRVDFGGGLVPGSRIVIPGKGTRIESAPVRPTVSTGGTYTVRPGDSLKAIAIRHGTTTAHLAAINGIKDANKVVVGQRLVLPGGKTSTRTVTSSKPKSTPKPIAPASDDTVPMPGVGLPDGMPPPPSVPLPSSAASTPPKPTPSPSSSSDSHRGVLAYRIDATDSIDSIAAQFSTTPARIREINHLQPTTKLNAGDEIMVPALGAVAVGR